jgi:hypothetical protein
MVKRGLITSTIGIILIILGLMILAFMTEVSTKFFVGGLLTWLGIIIIGRTLTKKKISK